MRVTYFILLLIGHLASATPECDWAIQVSKDVPYRIDQNNSRINLLKSLIGKENDVLQKELDPQYNELSHTLSVYDFKSKTSGLAQVAIRDAISLVQSVVLSDETLKRKLERLIASGNFMRDQSLAQQLRSVIPELKLSRQTQTYLDQLLNAVERLEATQAGWQESEKQLMADTLTGKVSLADGLLGRLRTLEAELNSDLNQLSQGQSQDQSRLKNLQNTRSDITNKITGYQKEIVDLQAANAQQIANREKWAVDKHCPKYENNMSDRLGSVAF